MIYLALPRCEKPVPAYHGHLDPPSQERAMLGSPLANSGNPTDDILVPVTKTWNTSYLTPSISIKKSKIIPFTFVQLFKKGLDRNAGC